MKKFKTKWKYNYLKIMLVIIFFSIFILLSFMKLNKSYPKLVNFLTIEFKDNQRKPFILTNNLDYLINTYSFKEVNNHYQENNINQDNNST